MWVEKYRPQSLEEVVGNEHAKREFLQWLLNWKRRGKEMGVFLIGPQGTGKTSLLHAASKQLGFHIVELNASDVRNQESLQEALSRLPAQSPLDKHIGLGGRRILVFLDEVDGIYGREDRGGLSILLEFAERRDFILVLSANYPDPQKHKELLKDFKTIRFRPLTTRQIIIILKGVLEREGLTLEEERVREIALKSKGDARFAINLLQSAVLGYQGLEETVLDETLPLAETLNIILRSKDDQEVLRIISSSLAPPEEIFKALAETVASSEMDSERRMRVLDLLSRMDVVLGRIWRTGQWRLQRELVHMMPQAIDGLRGGGVVYVDKVPEYIYQRLFIHRSRREKLMIMAGMVEKRLNLSVRKTMVEVFPFLSLQLRRGNRALAQGFGFTKEEEKILKEVFP